MAIALARRRAFAAAALYALDPVWRDSWARAPYSDPGDGEEVVRQGLDSARDARFRRYMVNVLMSDGDRGEGAPIVEEANPTLGNLVGRMEHLAQMGTLVTDFLLIIGNWGPCP